MLTKLTNYLGEGFSINSNLKLNDELLKYVQRAVLELDYQNSQLYIRDLIYSHNKGLICQEFRKNSAGTSQELREEGLENQRVPVNQTSKSELLGTPLETPVKQVELPQLTNNSTNELRQIKQLIDNSTNELSQLRELIDNSTNELSQLKGNSTVDMSQVEIEDSFVPEGISGEQYRMYVRRLEDENVKLESALKICHNALEAKQQEGNLSAMMYQSELAIYQLLSWVQYHFQQFFPQGDVRQILTEDVRKFHPNFPYFKMPNS